MKTIIYVITLILIGIAAKSQPTISIVQNTNKYKISIPAGWPALRVESIPGDADQNPRTSMLLELGDGNFAYGDNAINNANQKYFNINSTQVANSSTAFAFILTRYEDSARPKLFAKNFTGQPSGLQPVISSTILKPGNPVINLQPYAPNAVFNEHTHFLISAKNRKGVIAFMYNSSSAPVFSSRSLKNDSFNVNNIKLGCVRVYQGQTVTTDISQAKTKIISSRQDYFDNCIKAYTLGNYRNIVFILNDGTDNSNINYFITLKADENITTVYDETNIQAVFIPYNGDSSSCARKMGYSLSSSDPNSITITPKCINFAQAASAFPADMHFTIHFQNRGLANVDTVTLQHILPHGFALGDYIATTDFSVGNIKKAGLIANDHIPGGVLRVSGIHCSQRIANKNRFDAFDTLVLKFFYQNFEDDEQSHYSILEGIEDNPYAGEDPATMGSVSYTIQFSPAASQATFIGEPKKAVIKPVKGKPVKQPVNNAPIIPSLNGNSKVNIFFHTLHGRTEMPVSLNALFNYCELLPRPADSYITR